MASSTAAFTELALNQFMTVFDRVVAEKGDHFGEMPETEELRRWMQKEIYSMDQTPAKKPLENIGETFSAMPVIKEERSDAASGQGKMSSKELKAKPMVFRATEAEEEVEKVIELPYLPDCIDYSCTCQALKVNGGLFTPCLTRPSKDSEFCKTCAKAEFRYGKLGDRVNVPVSCYADPKGKQEISYGTYISKRGLTREQAEQLIKDTYGDAITIPEHYWNVDKTKAARGVKKTKSVATSSDGETSSVEGAEGNADQPKKKRGRPRKNPEAANEPPKPKGKRGRPKKTEKVTEEASETVANEEDWMANIAQDEEEEASEKVPETKKVPVPTKKPVKKAPKKKAPEPQPKPEPEPEPEEEVEDHSDDEDEEEDEDMTYFSYKGKKYGYDEENVLYEIGEDDFKVVGKWDPETKKPVFGEDEA